MVESKAFASILGDPDRIKPFFESTWQKECKIWTNSTRLRGQTTKEARPSCQSWNRQRDMEQYIKDPYEDIVSSGWDILIQLMDETRRSITSKELDSEGEVEGQSSRLTSPPIFFKDQTSLNTDERTVYGESPMAAFLDGCSVVINHADLHSPWIAKLCEDLQNSFPHAYANTYWTPPNSQAVPAHADDRDVLIIQVIGEKHWKIYEDVPVPYPYPHEQVGKDGIAVPPQVLRSGALFDGILRAGDVMYMPRGFVHEARASVDQSSFHITIALATHDWTFAGAISNIVESSLTKRIDFRQALPRSFGTESQLQDFDRMEKEMVEKQINEAMSMIRDQLTIARIHDDMRTKLARHNQLARTIRSKTIARFNQDGSDSSSLPASRKRVNGRAAAETVVWSSAIRVATDQEKASVNVQGGPRGLNVRPESYDSLIALLQDLKTHKGVYKVCDILFRDEVRTNPNVCNATILCFVRQCVELGAFAVIVAEEAGERANKRKLELSY